MEDLSPPPPSRSPTPKQPYGHNKSLAIAVIVSAIFLLAAAGVSYWMLTKPASTTVAQQPTGDGSENVKQVMWLAPAEMPAAYVRREQNTQTVATTYYYDLTAGCGVTTSVQPMPSQGNAKQATIEAAKAGQAYGITVTANTDAAEESMKDEDGKHDYIFKGVQFEQGVKVTGVPYDAQRTMTFYKQFGKSIASISYSCKTASWDGKKTELQTLAKAFKVKTD